MRDNGISLRSTAHPRPALWKRIWSWMGPRPTINPAALTQVEGAGFRPSPSGLRITETPEPSTLIDKLRYVGAMNHGSFFPSWMIDENGSWGPKLSKICNDAATRIEQLEGGLQYVLEDESNGAPRATSTCREHVSITLQGYKRC